MLMNWLRDEEGQAMVEYGLIIALIAIAVILVLGLVGKSVAELFSTAADEIGNATTWANNANANPDPAG